MVAPTPLISSSMTPLPGPCAMGTSHQGGTHPGTQTLLGIRPGQALGAGPRGPRRHQLPSILRTGQPHGPRTANAGTSAGSSTRESGPWMRAACLLPPDLVLTAPGTGTGECSSRFTAKCQTCSWSGPMRKRPKWLPPVPPLQTQGIQGPSKHLPPGQARPPL